MIDCHFIAMKNSTSMNNAGQTSAQQWGLSATCFSYHIYSGLLITLVLQRDQIAVYMYYQYSYVQGIGSFMAIITLSNCIWPTLTCFQQIWEPYLGITINSKLTFNIDIDVISQKANGTRAYIVLC